ncbi:MAG: DNA adenine methylase [Ruminococcaceae bacterium]|nr:DNA adenine methylase [Oscillospiraceae bacterium]
MTTYSPLRYPGGKAKLSSFVRYVIENKVNREIDTYIEPFAGGAGVALDLLFNNVVENIIINDYDKAVYSFWKAAIYEANRFVERIQEINVTVEEWKNQKNIYTNYRHKYSFDLGFATFFLNRTNRSGILTAGPIGGIHKNGNYPINARFNKDDLIKKITSISQRRNNIKVYNKDIRNFIRLVIIPNQEHSFVYFDPPYFQKGKELYKNYFLPKDHTEIYSQISQTVTCPWLITYDNVTSISDMYRQYYRKNFDLIYSLANKGQSSEIMIFSSKTLCPTQIELANSSVKINLY